MDEPRILSSRSGAAFKISSPSNVTLPEQRPLIAVRPIAAIRIWLLPEPDSPTMPSTSPRRTSKLTPSTARTQPCSSLKSTVRSRADRIGIAPGRPLTSALVRIEGIAQAVSNEVETEQGGRQHAARQHQQARIGLDRPGAIVDQGAPGTRRRLNAKAKEAQGGFCDDDLQHQEAGIDDHDIERIRHDMLFDDLPFRHAAGTGGVDELPMAQRDR